MTEKERIIQLRVGIIKGYVKQMLETDDAAELIRLAFNIRMEEIQMRIIMATPVPKYPPGSPGGRINHPPRWLDPLSSDDEPIYIGGGRYMEMDGTVYGPGGIKTDELGPFKPIQRAIAESVILPGKQKIKSMLFKTQMIVEGVDNKTIHINGRVPNYNGTLLITVQDQRGNKYGSKVDGYVAGSIVGDVTFDDLPAGFMMDGRVMEVQFTSQAGEPLTVLFTDSYSGAFVEMVDDPFTTVQGQNIGHA